MKRFYFNLTNKCNTECPFCCMHSSPEKTTFLEFPEFEFHIWACADYEDGFELQLEGGEPFLHPNLYLFLEMAYYTNDCKKIIICTNGILLRKHIDKLTEFVDRSGILLEIKQSINFHLLDVVPNLLVDARNLLTAIEFIPNINLTLNVREREDEDLKPLLEKHKLLEASNVYKLQKYGKNDTGVEPFIVQNIEEWEIFASDGTSFGNDLIKRSEYEKGLE